MPGIKDLIADPEYQKLTLPEQRAILTRADTSFKDFTDDEVNAFNLKGRGAVEKTFNPQLKGVTEGFPPEKRIRTFKDVGRELIPKIRPFITGLGTAAGVAAAPATGGGSLAAILGILGGTGTDLAMQEAEKGFGGNPVSHTAKEGFVPPGSVLDTLAGAGENQVLNEVGGHAVRMIGRGIKGLLRPEPYDFNPMAQRLGDTYKKMIDYGGGPSYSQQNPGLIKKGVEDIFGGTAKETQLQNAARAGKAVSKDVLRSITEQPEISYGNYPTKIIVQPRVAGATDFKQPFEYPQEMTQLLGARAKELTNRANANADKVRMIAQTRPFNSRYSSTGIESDKGPIVPTSMVLKADEFLRDAFGADYHTRGIDQKFGLVADEEKPLIRTALDILKYAKRDPAVPDRILGVRPVPFDKAWKFKQEASGIGYGDDGIVSSFKNANFKKLGAAADDDIEKSLVTWGKNGKEALNAYQEAKALVSNRHDLFQQGDAITNLTKTAIGDSARPDYDKILTDPLLTGKAIAASGPGGRRNLQAYNLQQVLNRNTNQETGLFNREGLLADWKDPNKQEVFKKLYTSEQRGELNNFMEALANVSTKQSSPGRVSAAFRIGSSTVNIAGSLLSGGLMASSNMTRPGMVLGGAIATSELAKHVLMNPKIARGLTILMNQGPSSQEGRFLSRQVFTALEGVAMTLNTKDGPVPAKIEGGKVIPLQNE